MHNPAISRRAAMAGLAAAALAPAARTQTSEPDVVIVGAGSAGLSAARRLLALGRSVVVIEAMGRIGGRAFTESGFFGAPFDHGCAWLHAADRNPYTAEAARLGFTTVPHDYGMDAVFLDRRRANEREVAAIDAAEGALIRRIGAAGARRDVPASTVVSIDSPAMEAAGDYLGKFDFGVDLEDLSTADYANAADLDPNLLCKEGFGALVASSFSDILVRTATPARRIDYSGAGVRVETDAGTLAAKAVIVTASTGALASGRLAFFPELPVPTQNAIHHLPMGMLTKIPLLIRKERFGLAPFSDLVQERPGSQDIYFLAFPFDYDLMIGFVGGSFGWELSAAGQDAAVDFAKQRLADMFGADAPSKVEKGLMTAWASNPWVRGAYAAARPGHARVRRDLARPVANRVFFAGEALAGDLAQTCGGAALNGGRVAEAVHASLG